MGVLQKQRTIIVEFTRDELGQLLKACIAIGVLNTCVTTVTTSVRPNQWDILHDKIRSILDCYDRKQKEEKA